jgi:hypothetical protein
MEKQLIHFTSRFLYMNRLVLFLLIVFPITVRIYSPGSDDFTLFNRLFASIGGICLLSWLFAIGHKANEKLVSQSIHLNSFRFFNWSAILVVVSFILYLFFSTDANTVISGMKFNYATPIFLPVLLILSFFLTMVIAAKALVSAELNRDAGLIEYFTTVLLMVFAVIGLWFIQPRVKNI